MTTMTTARGRAIATQDEQIQRNIARIAEDRPRPTAIQSMASRLNLTPAKLQETLRQTVFREANDAEFAALIVVANEYKLNPLLKEIFAFKAKGGGIIPYVSVDGWIRIINEHPQFDGIDFNDIVAPDGEVEAIECVIWRKDRSRPIKIVEYMDECRRDSEPWRKSPKRFLRHRSLMQAGRVAFGFSGIGADDDYEVIPYATEHRDARNITPPRRDETREIPHDPDTGEVLSDEETAALDRQGLREMDGEDTISEENPAAQEGRADEERGELFNQEQAPKEQPKRTAAQFVDGLITNFKNAESTIGIQKILTDNADTIEDLKDKAPKQHARLIEACDLAWDSING